MSVITQIEVSDGLFDSGVNLVSSQTLEQAVVFESLLNCHVGEDCIILRAVSNQLSSLIELILNIKALDGDFSLSWIDFSGQTLESGRFTGTIDSQQSKALSIVKSKGRFVDSFHRHITHLLILFLEVVDSDTLNVSRISLILFVHHSILRH